MIKKGKGAPACEKDFLRAEGFFCTQNCHEMSKVSAVGEGSIDSSKAIHHKTDNIILNIKSINDIIQQQIEL